VSDRRRAFVLESAGDHPAGRAEDVSRRTLARLRRGEYDIDDEIDLHGLRAADAERALTEELEDALEDGARCIRVIHGQGHHSRQEPVLKRSLPTWLVRSPVAPEIMAFATAPQKQGGAGATLVLLRRAR
jgi:DNA-nicking Smr family endonuclease